MIGTISFVMGLAGLALYSHIGATRAEQRFPPIGDFVEVEGLRMHFVEQGRGPSLVLIHGASTSLLDFQASLTKPLSTAHHVVTVDRPGHGYSERPAGGWPNPAAQARLIRGLLRELGVENPILVGHSWSGSVVLAYLLAYPDEAAGGVLLAGGSHPWEGGVAWHNDLAGIPVLGHLFARTLVYPLGRLALETAVAGVFDPDPVPDGYRARTGVELSLRPNVFLANAEDIRRLSSFLAEQSRGYKDIRRPLLLVTGDQDRIVPSWNHAARLIRQAPKAELAVLEGAGHALHHAHSRRVASLIGSFTERLLPATGAATRRPTHGGGPSQPIPSSPLPRRP